MTTPTITRLKLPAVRRAVESTPWAIQREKLLAMLEVLEVHATGGGFSAADIQARVGDRKPITKSGGAIAVLPLHGVVSQRMSMFAEYSGGTSTERFADEFDAAIANNDVSAIVIDCDSPGGNVQGTPELAKRIYDARGKKKIIAVANGTMASAAYWICSAADEVVVTPSGEVGSIGVFCVHLDESGMNEQLGLKYTLISAGDFKTEGNQYEPLSEEAEAFTKGQVNEMYGTFINNVAKHRGTDAKSVKADYGQGRCFTAKQAFAAGMVDRIATLEETLKSLGAKENGASGRPRAAAALTSMAAETVTSIGQPGAHLTLSGLPIGSSGIGGAAVSITLRADAAPETEPAAPAVCPDCGGDLDEDACTNCEYTAPAKADDDDTSARAGGAAATSDQLPDHRPDAAIEETAMDDVKAAVAAERTRANAIAKLGKIHRIADEQVEAMIAEGLTIDQASTRVLGHVEARGAAAPNIRVGADREAEQPFATAGEQLHAIIQHTRTGRRDARLTRVNHDAMRIDREGAMDMIAGPSGMNESVGSEGGFFIAPEVLPGLIEPVYQTDPLLSRVTRIPIGSNSNRTVYNVVDESARTDGNRWGGIQMFYADEADTVAAKKPKLRPLEQLLKKIMGIGYLTEEQVQDAPASQTLLNTAFTTELQFMLGNEVYRGTGGAHILGFLKGKGGVTQAIEAAQTIANTDINISMNVAKMKANIPASLWKEVIWLYNQELYPKLLNAKLGGTSVPAFTPASGGGEMGSVDRIGGAPAFVSELCEQEGTIGDILCIAPSQYHFAEKGGAQVATSLHVRFINDELTLKITYRADGKPVWNTTVTPFKGTAPRGFYSTLNTRT